MQTILFTGARSGIINKVINKIVDKNYFIYLTVHTENQLEVVTEKYKNNKNVKCLKLDIRNLEDRKQLKNLDIDILVSNAGIGESGSIAEIKMDRVRDNFETNVFSNFEVVQLVLKNMIKKGKGRLVMISSLAGIIPIPFLSPYCATKASIITMTKALNMELKFQKSKIKISLIEPGLYNTGFNRLMLDKKYEWMNTDSYFKNQIDLIKKTENIFLTIFEKQNLNTIINKITKAITKEKPKFTYKAPFFQSVFGKIYKIISK